MAVRRISRIFYRVTLTFFSWLGLRSHFLNRKEHHREATMSFSVHTSEGSGCLLYVCVYVWVCTVYVRLWGCSWRLIPGLYLLSILLVEIRTFAETKVPQLCGTGLAKSPRDHPALFPSIRITGASCYVWILCGCFFWVQLWSIFLLYGYDSGCTHVLCFGLALETVPSSKDPDFFW